MKRRESTTVLLEQMTGSYRRLQPEELGRPVQVAAPKPKPQTLWERLTGRRRHGRSP